MSYTATKWAYDLPLTGSAKGILVALADMADEENSCYPGQEKLATMTGRSVKTVERALKYLEAAKLISRVHRYAANGWRTSDRFKLDVDVLTVELPDKTTTSQDDYKSERLQVNLSELPDTLSPTTRQDDGAMNHQVNHQEPSDSVRPPQQAKPKTGYSDNFEAFWRSYPKRESKGDAWKAWEALRKTRSLPPLPELIAAAERYGRSVADPQFLKLPAGWLRARKWEDEGPNPVASGWGGVRELGA